ADHPGERVHVPRAIVRGDERGAQRMEETGAPLRAEPRAAAIDRPREPRIVLHVLGDRDLPRLALADITVDPLQQIPAIGQVGARIVIAPVPVADPSGGSEPQAVAATPPQPPQRIVTNVLPHLVAPVVGARIAPRRLPAPIVVEIDPALAV